MTRRTVLTWEEMQDWYKRAKSKKCGSLECLQEYGFHKTTYIGVYSRTATNLRNLSPLNWNELLQAQRAWMGIVHQAKDDFRQIPTQFIAAHQSALSPLYQKAIVLNGIGEVTCFLAMQGLAPFSIVEAITILLREKEQVFDRFLNEYKLSNLAYYYYELVHPSANGRIEPRIWTSLRDYDTTLTNPLRVRRYAQLAASYAQNLMQI